MAAISANPYSSGIALGRLGSLLPKGQTRTGADPKNGAQSGVIDVRAKRVRVEDLATRRGLGRTGELKEGELLEAPVVGKAFRTYADAMAEFEDEMLRQPFMYERSRAEGGMVLKSAPIKRGIFVDVGA